MINLPFKVEYCVKANKQALWFVLSDSTVTAGSHMCVFIFTDRLYWFVVHSGGALRVSFFRSKSFGLRFLGMELQQVSTLFQFMRTLSEMFQYFPSY